MCQYVWFSICVHLSFYPLFFLYQLVRQTVNQPVIQSGSLSVCLSVHLSVCLSPANQQANPSACLSFCLDCQPGSHPVRQLVSLSICLSVCLSAHLSVFLSVCRSVFLLPISEQACLSFCLTVLCQPGSHPVRQLVSLSICPSFFLSVHLSVCLSTCLFVYLSVSPPVCLSISCQSIGLSVFQRSNSLLPVWKSPSQAACQYIHLSVSHSIHLSVSQSVHLSVCPFFFSVCTSVFCQFSAHSINHILFVEHWITCSVCWKSDIKKISIYFKTL